MEIIHFALLLQWVLRLETLDEIDKIASFDKSNDGGTDPFRRARYDCDPAVENPAQNTLPVREEAQIRTRRF